jgi:hypothetical protein
MPYILAVVIVAAGVVLGIFTNPSPSGSPRGNPASPGTANERVGQR